MSRSITLMLAFAIAFPGRGAVVTVLSVEETEFKANTGHQADVSTSNTSGRKEFKSDFQILAGNASVEAVPGNFVEIRARYTALAEVKASSSADIGLVEAFKNDYTLSFAASFPTYFPVRATITSVFAGQVDRLIGPNDRPAGSATIGERSAYSNLLATDPTIPNTGLDLLQTEDFEVIDDKSRASDVFFRSGGLYGVNFAYTMGLGSFGNAAKDGPDMAYRLGISSDIDASAGEYPGIGNREMTTDGHFITVRFTVLPEANTGLLTAVAGLGFGGLLILRRLSRRAV